MAEITLDFIARQQDAVLGELRRVRNDIADLKMDMEVQTAIIRRLDTSVQGLTGEVRALAGQQSRQRLKLDRLEARLDAMEPPVET
jgi:chromosome segregation ATPase